jgi:Prokaryotic membrane lipoprotein lipid attachment site
MKKTLELLAITAAIALAGCSESASQPHATCELMTAQICSRAAESKLHDGTFTVSYSFRPEEARVVPFVVPVMRPDGVLATEVDCYANTDSRTYSIVRSDLAIPPGSEESLDFLRARHLCADEGSYAKDERSRVETALSLPLITR